MHFLICIFVRIRTFVDILTNTENCARVKSYKFFIMNLQEYLRLIKAKKQTIFSLIVLFLLLALVLTFIQPFKYQASSRLLVVQSAPAGIDPYQVNKANEYVSEVLAKIVPTNSFFNQVMNAGFNIDKTYFPTEPKKQLKKWKSTVIAQPSSKGGIITISVFHSDQGQADQIVRAVDSVLKSTHQQYHGNGDAVSIRIIDQPFTTDMPVKPNVPMNIGLAFAFGLIFALSYIYLFPEEAYDLRMLPRRKKKAKFDQDDIAAVNEALEKLRSRGLRVEAGNVPEKLPIVDDYEEYPVGQEQASKRGEAEELEMNDILRQGSMGNIRKR